MGGKNLLVTSGDDKAIMTLQMMHENVRFSSFLDVTLILI